MSNKGKKLTVLSHSNLIKITLWAEKNKASIEGLSPTRALELAKTAFPNVDLIESTLVRTLKQIGIELEGKKRNKAPNGQPNTPRLYNLAKCVKVLYEKLGEPIPDVLSRMANQYKETK